MATLEQIGAALRAADAAGAEDDARALARAYKEELARQESGQAEPALRHHDGRLTEAGWAREIEATKQKRRDEVESQSFLGSAVAGYGRAVPVMWSGIKQAGTEAIQRPVQALTYLADAAGSDAIRDGLLRNAGVPIAKSLERQQQDIDSERAASADLMSTGGGIVGNIAGNLAPMLIGGGAGLATKAPQAARASGSILGAIEPIGVQLANAAGRAALPQKFAGNVIQGGLLSALQPTATGENRLGNTASGAAMSGAAFGMTKIPGAVSGAVPSFRRAAQEAKAGQIIDSFSANPAAVRSALAGGSGEIIQGSLPTTAEATGDVGLGNLQRLLQSNNAGGFNPAITLRHEANNAARVGAIQSAFGGATDDAADAIRSARDLAARQSLRPIDSIGVDVSDVRSAVSAMEGKSASSKLAREVLAEVNEELGTIRTVGDAHKVRQYIGQLMGGKVEGKANASFATKQLAAVRDILDRKMRGAFPEWGDFLRDYRGASRTADQTAFGARLLDKSNAARDVGGNPVLNASTLRAIGRPESIARQANPGFRGASADSMLTQPQRDVMSSVRNDLERQTNTLARGKASGNSSTFQNLTGGAQLQQEFGQWLMPVASAVDPSGGIATGAINAARARGGDRVAQIVSDAMMNPQRAAEILARAPSKERVIAERIVADAFRQAARAAETTRQGQRPLEIDIIGGRRESDAIGQ